MLTDAALKALKPKEKIYKVADRDGMYVRVMPSGAISFRLDYRLNGRRETWSAPFEVIHPLCWSADRNGWSQGWPGSVTSPKRS